MRLFVAVEIDERVREIAARVSADMRQRLNGGAGVRWIPAHNLHLTVRFVGHVAAERSAAMLDALSRPLETVAFDVTFAGCGRFPPRGRPRVLWIGLTAGLPSLAALHDEFNRRLAPFGYEPETRPFNAHLTLARFKDAPARTATDIRGALDVVTGSVTQHVTRVTIFESHLSPAGPRYEPVARVPLRQPIAGSRQPVAGSR